MWILLGDFNEIPSSEEVCDGFFIASQTMAFSEMIEKCSLLDVGMLKVSYTWSRCRIGNDFIFKKLYCSLADISWCL